MSVSPEKLKKKEHSKCDLRITDLEAGFKKHEELLKAVENLSKQSTKKNQVIIFS
jgi:hypothetical protein